MEFHPKYPRKTVEKVIKLFENNTPTETAKIMGLPPRTVLEWAKRIKKGHTFVFDEMPEAKVIVEEKFPQSQIENSGKTEFQDLGNYATVEKKTRKSPESLEDLIEIFDIDIDVWKVDHWVANSWDVTIKTPNGETLTVPNYQVKAWLIRRIPIKHEWPVIQPIIVKNSIPQKPKSIKKSIYKALIIPDSQNGYSRNFQTNYLDPFHDRKAWDIVLQVAQTIRPDLIIFLGDMLDLPMWTDKYIRSPDFYFTTQPSLEELFWWLGQFIGLGSELHYFSGNHEVRLESCVITNTIEAYGLKPANHPDAPPAMSIENLLSLKELGIKYHGPYPKGELWINNNLRVSHGETVRQGSGDSVKNILKDARNSEIAGHVHRLESMHKTSHPHRGPVVYGAYSVGTIARIDPGVVPAAAHRLDWQQGFAVVDYELGNGFFDVNLCNIYGGVSIYNGKRYENRNIKKMVAEITEATGWDFRKK